MKLLGLSRPEIVELIRGVRGADDVRGVDVVPGVDALGSVDGVGVHSDDGGRDGAGSVPDPLARFARAAWTCVAEPGDGVAGALVAAIGPIAALRAVEAASEPSGPTLAAAARREVPDTGRPAAELPDGAELPDDDALADAMGRWRSRLDGASVARALRQAHRFSARLLVPGDADWPGGLADLGVHAPLALWLRGDPAVLGRAGRASIAIVGARAASGYGEHVAVEAAAGLVDRGFAIVSGAAYGIDGSAHRAALASGGATVAVLAGGVDRFYPSGHEDLLNRIVRRGAVIAEVPCGAAPSKWRFLLRNRLIAAIASATVVVEAGWRSGSLNTAGHAAALGRPLGAVPGPVTSSTSAGCHRLLREYDAVCVTTPGEMAELAPGALDTIEQSDASSGRGRARDGGGSGANEGTGRRPSSTDGARVRVLDAMSARTPRAVEAIARESGLDPGRVRAELGVLQLEGRVRDGGAGWTRAR
jgi:DNA processing protein